MCGIVGLVDVKREYGADALDRIVAGMADRVAHRGPDGSGVHVDFPVALGHRRLAIIDLTEGAAQPMTYDDGRYVIVYNGEIYNYIELRELLITLGCRFTTHSDTEVILAAYKTWGQTCVTHFNGMWAIAIWDKQERELFLSRDRFGVKPLYIVHNERHFAFASEIRQLLPLFQNIQANRASVIDFLSFNAADHGMETFFHNIYKFPQGHVGLYSLAGNTLKSAPFYSLAAAEGRTPYASPEEACQHFRELMESAISLRLRSDVPIGIALSGGLDSSWIAAIAHRLNTTVQGGNFIGFTAINDIARYDETPFVERLLEQYHFNWKCIRPKDEDFVSLCDQVIAAQEEPMLTTSPIAQYQVMSAVADSGIKVLLSGQGADELFLGYHKFIPFYVLSLMRQNKWREAYKQLQQGYGNTTNLGHKAALKYLLAARFPQFRAMMQRSHAFYLRDIFKVPTRNFITDFSSAQRQGIFAMQHNEIYTSPLPLLLRYEDKNSMHFGVESRLPFLDYRIVEFALSLPWEMKIKDGWTKWIMRHASTETLPSEVAWRRYKVAYNTPEARWLKMHHDTIKERVCNNHLLAELCHTKLLRNSWNSLPMTTKWRLYALSSWSEIFHVERCAA